MSAPDVVPGYLGIVPEGSSFRNEVAARVAFDILRSRPGRRAVDVSCPLHITLCDADSVAPARASDRLVRRAPRVEVTHQRFGHFDVYAGEGFERVVADQVAFLQRHVPVAART